MAIAFQALLLPIAAGLAVFMAGMKIMEHALYAWTGGWMKSMLARLTGTPLLGLLTGTGTTAVLQSSSAVTVVTIGMVNAGVLSFPRTLGIILGTNIGTCLTTELIGLNLSAASLPALAASTALWLAACLPLPVFRKAGRVVAAVRGLSLAAAGFCGIMLGIRIMQGIVPYLQERGFLAWFLEHAQRSPLWGIIAGAILTAVIHSSAASIAMTMSLAGLGAIPVPLGIAIVLGCNVGTCVTALIAGIGGGRFGRYVAYSHLILNVAGTVLFYPFIELLHAASAWITAEPAGQIAHAQTIFNVICSLLALPVCYLPAIRRIGGDESAIDHAPDKSGANPGKSRVNLHPGTNSGETRTRMHDSGATPGKTGSRPGKTG
jgi:phosphate:Na+ symporter